MFRFRRGDVELPESPGDRLDSWKEIAAYLKRDVSTLHRWEKQENLPVHRHHHKRASSVYAYKSELDGWWDNHLDLPDSKQPDKGHFLGFHWYWIALAFVSLLLVFASIGWVIFQSGQSEPDVGESILVLLSEFEGLSDNRALESTIAKTLERELVNLPGINLVSRPRIEAALRLMKRPGDTRIGSSVGREVCLRDGDIPVLLTGRFDKVDTTYVLSISLVNPDDESTVSTYAAEFKDESEVLGAIQELSGSIGQGLMKGWPRVRPSEHHLQKVTTPSLRALQLFSQADALERELVQNRERRTDHSKVAVLLRSALAEDPDFAVAHCWLAWVQMNQGEPAEEYLESARKAVELSNQVSERERHIILGSLPALAGDYEEAIPHWEALLERYPNDYWGINNLAEFYRATGRRKESTQLLIRLAELHPENFELNLRAGTLCISWLGDHNRAKPLMARARDLISADVLETRPRGVAWLRTYPALESWLEGDIEETLAVAGAVSAELASLRGLQRRAFTRHVAATYLCLGRLKVARRYYQEAGFGAYSWFLAAYQLEVSPESARGLLEGDRIPKSTHALFVLARAGLLDEAREIIAGLETKRWAKQYSEIVLGVSNWIRGEPSQAVDHLASGASEPFNGIPGFFFLASEFLAQILEEQGDLGRATLVLEEASRRKMRVTSMEHLAFWTRNEWLLAGLYRKTGRLDAAQRIEAELSHLLSYADSDHPFLARLGTRD